MEEGLTSICRRGKYRNCWLYTFFNLYECRLGIESQIQLAKMFPYMWSCTPYMWSFQVGWIQESNYFQTGNLLKKKGGNKKNIFSMYLENRCFPWDDRWFWNNPVLLYGPGWAKRKWEQIYYNGILFISSCFSSNDEQHITTIKFQKKNPNCCSIQMVRRLQRMLQGRGGEREGK